MAARYHAIGKQKKSKKSWTFFLFGTARGQIVLLLAVAICIVVGGATALMSTKPLYATTDPDEDGIFNPGSFTQCIWFGG